MCNLIAMTSPWMTREEAAEYLRCSVPTIDRYARSGLLPKHRLGRAVLFKKEELDALVEPDSATQQECCAGQH